ncbi:DUF4040 domain-containing protein [bacterium]|nr:DUF4040 domain-containing protein [bacterium]
MNPCEFCIPFIILLTWIAAVYVIFAKKIMHAVIVTGFVSLIASVLFLLMKAPDVALTEASIGAGLTIAIFVFAIRKIEQKEGKDGKR